MGHSVHKLEFNDHISGVSTCNMGTGGNLVALTLWLLYLLVGMESSQLHCHHYLSTRWAGPRLEAMASFKGWVLKANMEIVAMKGQS